MSIYVHIYTQHICLLLQGKETMYHCHGLLCFSTHTGMPS